jgi:1-acyl-sn-glycerol-3-phosphate acyltransferase
MLLIAWANSARPQALIKHTYFKGVVGWVLRNTGGVPLDRDNPGAAIRALLKEAEGEEPFLLAIAAEGTRGKGEYWKPGFYRIAQQTGLPISLGFVDGPTRTLGIGPSFHPSGDVGKDMDFVRAFYADKQGIRPENRTEPRLREEAG